MHEEAKYTPPGTRITNEIVENAIWRVDDTLLFYFTHLQGENHRLEMDLFKCYFGAMQLS